MSDPIKVIFPSLSLRLAGELYQPSSSAPSRHGAAIVISHPMTGVKEQTSATYARALSAAGFLALAFDAGYQGESTGLPRGLEDPHQRAEDVKSAVSYLTTLTPEVDSSRIGVLGICASGGYTSFAAQTDTRIKALATVSAACVGRMNRAGGVQPDKAGREDEALIAGTLKAANDWRTAHASDVMDGPGELAPRIFDAEACLNDEDADPFDKDAASYYGTSRGKHERSTQRIPTQSFDLMMNYDSFQFQHLIAPRALLMIAGSEAPTRHYSETAVKGAREPKDVFLIEGKTHCDLYDDLKVSGPKLVEFFGKYLA